MKKISYLHPGNASSPHALRRFHSEELYHLDAIIRHPRSLARTNPTWRPPRMHLPGHIQSTNLNVTITRRRISQTARDILRQYGAAEASYIITLRFTQPHSKQTSLNRAEAWVRALLPDSAAPCVHQLAAAGSATFCWFTDSKLIPIPSPSWIFEGYRTVA
ncbi:hypothetical protein [Corynebacterium caspium]|uniref:hypothetical protein n=1 Tax=Corynebacterium caspium TaxID=234828 RepID=UPI000379CE48|nr:hypothetical protein [Corynebacterium caspium]WKD59495.1 hypothetical protein CCASP_05540 [Corynebacterium caspium DSM 44850]